MYETPATPARKFREVGSSVQRLVREESEHAPRKVESQNFQTLTPTCGAARLSIQCGGSGAILCQAQGDGDQPPRARRKGPEGALAKTHRRTIKYETRFFS
jgi:hypothetical protein